MKNALLRTAGIGTVLASMIGFAGAADLPLKAPPPAAPATWSGCYVGLEGGILWGTLNASGQAPSPAVPAATIDGSGGLVGGTFGCQAQMQQWVIGLEDDISWVSANGSANAVPPFAPAVGSGSQDWLDTLRARFGYAAGNVLFFVSGGAAFTTVKTTDTVPGLAPATISFNATGWTVGGGLEVKFAPQWSAKAEYLYMDFGTHNTNFSTINPALANISNRLTENLFRVGVNYRFW